MREYTDKLNLSDLDLDALGFVVEGIDRQAIDVRDVIPDVRDGLTRKQRAILYCLHETQKEFGNRMVPTITLYGRVLEFVDISQEEFQVLLSQMAGMTRDTHL